MKDYNFLMDAISQIDDDLIVEAQKSHRHPRLKAWIAIAAAIAIVICAVSIRSSAPPASPETPKSAMISGPQVSGFEKGFVGNISVSAEPPYSASILSPPTFHVTAKALEILPDTYHFIGDRNNKFRLVHMQTLRAFGNGGMVETFYYILPEAAITDLTKYDALVITYMYLFGHKETIVYNDTQNRLDVTDLAIFGYYTYLCSSNIKAFTDGEFDISLWTSTPYWEKEIHATGSPPEQTSLSDYEAYIQEHSPGCSYVGNPLSQSDVVDVQVALQYVKPFTNGVYIPDISKAKTSAYYGVEDYRRYINGYPTNERILIYPTFAIMPVNRFTDEDIAALPNLSSGLQQISTAYNSGQITPPHIKELDKLRFVDYSIFGWYAKSGNDVYGIIRVTWQYSDDTQQFLYQQRRYDDQYYLMEVESDTCTPISPDTLMELLGNSLDFIAGTNGYSDQGRYPPKYLALI